MTNPALTAVEERADEIAALAQSNEKLGRLDDAAAKLLRDTGVIRMFQPAKYGGAEAHPREFAETVMRIASLDGSTGWVADIVGLRGTGSKDIIVKDVFVPENRVVAFAKFLDGSQPREAGLTNPTYHIPFTTAFPLGITSAVIGIAEGALAAHLAYQKTRVQITGTRITDDPYVLTAISAAAEEIKASRTAMLDNVSRFYDAVEAGREITFADRAASRRTQVAAAWRAVRAMDEVVARSGGNGLRMDNPIQRFWRDGHMGLAHAIHVPGAVFHVSALTDIGVTPPPGPLLSMI